MKKLSTIVAIFAFVAAAIGLIVAAVYFLDRKFGFFGGDEEVEDVEFLGEEYYAEDLNEEPEAVEEAAPVEEAPAAEEQA